MAVDNGFYLLFMCINYCAEIVVIPQKAFNGNVSIDNFRKDYYNLIWQWIQCAIQKMGMPIFCFFLRKKRFFGFYGILP